jgi:hypothetical protein
MKFSGHTVSNHCLHGKNNDDIGHSAPRRNKHATPNRVAQNHDSPVSFCTFGTSHPTFASVTMATTETTFLRVVSHPYYPLNATIAPYLENEWHFTTLLAVFAAGCTAIFTATTLVVRRVRPGLPTSEWLTILWFVLSGCIHLFFEGI